MADNCTGPKFNVIIACARPWNLPLVIHSVERNITSDLDYEIIVIFDLKSVADIDGRIVRLCKQTSNLKFVCRYDPKNNPGGHAAKNFAISSMIDGGFVYQLDDDNLLFPGFFERTCAILSENPTKSGLIFSQKDRYRAEPDSIKAGTIDTAMYLLSRELIGDHRIPEHYGGDGEFIERIYKDNPDRFILANEDLCYYNKLEILNKVDPIIRQEAEEEQKPVPPQSLQPSIPSYAKSLSNKSANDMVKLASECKENMLLRLWLENPAKFCYWSIGDGNHGRMLATLVKSARIAGVKEDIHVWTDNADIPSCMVHPLKEFEKGHYWFKLKFLRDEVSNLDYDYYVYLDADTYFVRNPGNLVARLMNSSPMHAFLETNVNAWNNSWWGCPHLKYDALIREAGVCSNNVYNLNGGFWIVHREAVNAVFDLSMWFLNFCYERGYVLGDEAILSYAMHMLCKDPDLHILWRSLDTWAIDVRGEWKDRLPDGTPFTVSDWFTGEKHEANPAIVHAPNSKGLLEKGL